MKRLKIISFIILMTMAGCAEVASERFEGREVVEAKEMTLQGTELKRQVDCPPAGKDPDVTAGLQWDGRSELSYFTESHCKEK